MAKRTPQPATEEIKENPIGLDRKKVTPVVRSLNQGLATVYTFYHQVKKHHWLVEGPEYLRLHEFLDEWAAALLKTGDLLAERITALGGYPVSGPTAQAEMSLIQMEPEGAFDQRDMLEKDLEDAAQIAQAFRQHIQEAVEAGDYGTETMLKKELLAHEMMTHHLEHFIAKMSLVEELVK